MRILVISDSHGNDEQILKVLKKEKEYDALIHLGDLQSSEEWLRSLAGCPCFIVAGNCDTFSDLPDHLITVLGGRRVFLTHGNRFGVSSGTDRLSREAAARGCDIAMFGHTHCPAVVKHRSGVLLLNPGSVTFPRQNNRRPSYLILTISAEGEAEPQLRYL